MILTKLKDLIPAPKDGKGVSGTNIYYKADSSTPSTPSGAPASNPSWADNGNSLITNSNATKHLYESTCTTYTDGTYSWSTPIDDGLIQDMASSAEQFALADSGTTAPSSGWSTSVTPTAGKWVWSRTVLTFKDNSTKVVNTQCVGYCGTKGDKGDKGDTGDKGDKGDTGDKGDKGDNGDDAVTYQIVFTEAWARVDSGNSITARLRGYAYKIEGSTRTPMSSATIRMGYILNNSNTYVETTTNSSGYFKEDNWFDGDDYGPSGYAQGSQVIFAAIIVGGAVKCVEYVTMTLKGDKGNRGPTLRGPQLYSDLPSSFYFYKGGENDQFIDVVIDDNGQYYLCKKNHVKSNGVAPGATGWETYWSLGTNFDIVATKILLATYALIKNLGVENVEAKDANNNTIFSVRNGVLVCNGGTIGGFKISSSRIGAEDVDVNNFLWIESNGKIRIVRTGSGNALDVLGNIILNGNGGTFTLNNASNNGTIQLVGRLKADTGYLKTSSDTLNSGDIYRDANGYLRIKT